MIKIKRLGLAVVMSLTVLPCWAQRQWTLDECVQYAQEHNINIQQREVQLKNYELDCNTSQNAWLPQVDAQVGQQFSFGNYNATVGSMNGEQTSVNNNLAYTTGKFGFSMPVFNGFKIKNQIQSDKFNLEAASADLERARKDIGIRIATQYMQCLYYKSMTEVAQSQVDVSRKTLEKAQILFEEGKRPASEKAQAEAILASDQYELVKAEGQQRLALLDLAQLLNLTSAEDFDIAVLDDVQLPEIAENEQAMYESVVEAWPSVVYSKALIEKGKADIEIARAAYYPSLSLVGYVSTFYVDFFNQDLGWGGFGTQFFNNNLNEVIGVHLNIPVFSRMQTRNRLSQAKFNLTDRQLALDEARLALHNEIQTAYTNVSVAYDRYLSAMVAVEAAEVSVNYEQDRYDAGRGTIFDLQQSQQKHVAALHDALQAKYEYLIRNRILDFYRK